MDAIEQFKDRAKQAWASFVAFEATTGTAAPRLVRYAGITSGQRVLDVGCGTGVVALTAARLGAKVTGLDLSPRLIERAKENAALMQLDVSFVEGDAEQLPMADASFDVVVSQFGHIFAPRPAVATAEMLRVLRPGGRIAFSTWPPELFTGKVFALTARYAPAPPPPGVSPPQQWGDPAVVAERLGDAVVDLCFDRDVMRLATLSPQHLRLFNEQNIGFIAGLVKALEASDPQKLAALRKEVEALAACYFEDNLLRQDYLLSRATKR